VQTLILRLAPFSKQPIYFLSTQNDFRRGYIVENRLKIYGVSERYVYDSEDRFFVFTECDIQARDSRIDFGSRIVLRQATKKASCEVNQSGARYNGCRVPTLNIARNEELFWREHRTENTAFERDCCLSGISCDRVINTRDFIIIELLSSRKKYVAKYRRDTCKYNRRLQQGQIYDREMADSSKVPSNRRVFVCDSSFSRGLCLWFTP